MPNAILRPFHKNNAIDFFNKYSGTSDNLYIALGDHDVGWAAPMSPDAVSDHVQEVKKFWGTDVDGIIDGSNLVSMHQIANADILPVVPRKTWTANNIYVAFDDKSTTAWDSAYYVINSASHVYKCTQPGTGASTDEPNFVSNTPTTLSDGYQWKYLYNLSTSQVRNTLTDSWLPVLDHSSEVFGANGIDELDPRHVIIHIEVEAPPTKTLTHRQIALISNPKDAPGTANLAVANLYFPDDKLAIKMGSGNLMHLENHTDVTRTANQDKIIIKLVVEF